MDIGDLTVTAKAVRHARNWFESSQRSLGIFYALGNVTARAINLVALDEKYMVGRNLRKLFLFSF